MATFLISFFTVVLVLLSLIILLLVLMQKSSANSSMGSALGGGAAEQALGADANNILTKLTIRGTIVFFVMAFGLYMANQYLNGPKKGNDPKSLIEGIAVEAKQDESANTTTGMDVEKMAADLEQSINTAVKDAVEEVETKASEIVEEIQKEASELTESKDIVEIKESAEEKLKATEAEAQKVMKEVQGAMKSISE